MSTLVRQVSKAVTLVLFVMQKSKRRGGSSSSNSSENRQYPAVTPGTRSTRHRTGACEQADAANPIPGSSSCPPGVPMASLTLEQLMEEVGAM